MTSFAHPDVFLDLVGQELGVSDWVLIDQARIDAFADATNDHQWVHVDVERAAREMPTGSTIAHGFLVLSLLAPLSYEILEVENVAHELNYGLDKVRFTAMVPAGSRIRLRQSLVRAEKRDDGAVFLELLGTMELEGSERPAAIIENLRLVYARS
ncbi:MAG: MaoC family dehydratase [Alphaproteobacteria bacterium]|nr:MaoC family dehydratase [Alphaproteobacteria bacterium]